jgi:ATP sulfurylase
MTYNKEIGIEILDFKQLVYVASLDEYVTADRVPPGEKPLSISGTKFRAMMNAGEPIPEWFSHPDVIKILRVRGSLERPGLLHVSRLLPSNRKCRPHWTSAGLRCFSRA